MYERLNRTGQVRRFGGHTGPEPVRPSSSSVREGAYPLIPGVPSDPPSGDYVPAAELAKSSTFLVGSYVTTMTGPSGYDRPGPNETDDAAPGIVALRSP